jgi:hypothetical protein
MTVLPNTKSDINTNANGGEKYEHPPDFHDDTYSPAEYNCSYKKSKYPFENSANEAFW